MDRSNVSRIGPRNTQVMRILLTLICLSLLLLSPGCDMSWEQDAHNAYLQATFAERDHKFDDARASYEYALTRNPFHAPANKNLANLLESRYREDALAHYCR